MALEFSPDHQIAYQIHLLHYERRNRENKPKFHPNPKLKLMDQVREVLRYHRYSYRTEQAYCKWILRYIGHFGEKAHPKLIGAKNIEALLALLATESKVTASTQRPALNALVFLCKHVLDMHLDNEIFPQKNGHHLLFMSHPYLLWQLLPLLTITKELFN